MSCAYEKFPKFQGDERGSQAKRHPRGLLNHVQLLCCSYSQYAHHIQSQPPCPMQLTVSTQTNCLALSESVSRYWRQLSVQMLVQASSLAEESEWSMWGRANACPFFRRRCLIRLILRSYPSEFVGSQWDHASHFRIKLCRRAEQKQTIQTPV